MMRCPRGLVLMLSALAAHAAMVEDVCETATTQEQDEALLMQTPAQKPAQAAKQALSAPTRVMKLHRMEDKGLDSSYGAVCLDGSPGAFYISKGEDDRDWLILLEGGGWCTSPWDCFVARANDTSSVSFGSSKGYPEIGPDYISKGLNSLNCSISPFCNFNQVFVRYCDGTSYSGNLDEPVSVLTTDRQHEIGKVYFRGQRIFDAVVDTLLQDFGLDKAKSLLFAGCSAGGLGATLHTDYIHERVKQKAPGLEKFGSVPISGFFINKETTMGYPLYTSQMQQLFNLANWTTLYKECAAHQFPEVWKCNFAKVAYRFIKSPIFLVNSALDQWQTRCILASKLWDNGDCAPLPGFGGCASNITKCTAEQLPVMNGHMNDFVDDVKAAKTFDTKGNGAFISACHYHCEGTEDWPFQHFQIGDVTMREAVRKWWESDFQESAHVHSHVEQCRYGVGSQCNPTCRVFVPPFR